MSQYMLTYSLLHALFLSSEIMSWLITLPPCSSHIEFILVVPICQTLSNRFYPFPACHVWFNLVIWDLFPLPQGSPTTPERRQVSAPHQRMGPGSQPSVIKHCPPRLHGWVCYIYIKEISAPGKYSVTTLPSKKKKTIKSITVLWFSTASAGENA